MKTKINLSMLIITSLICLLPLVFGFTVYDYLPDQTGIPYFGTDTEGNFNRSVNKIFPAYILALLWFALNIFSRLSLSKYSGIENYPKEIQSICDWAPPIMSLFTVPLWLFYAMGITLPIYKITFTIAGIICIIFGNYFPKIKQKEGYKAKILKQLNDPDIYNKTNRMWGYLFLIGGIIFIISPFVTNDKPLAVLFYLVIGLIIIIPLLYSIIKYISKKT